MLIHLADCSELHSPAMLAILNHAILHSTALYDYVPRSMNDMAQWWDAKRRGKFPVVGAFDGDTLLGFGALGTFRAFPCYKYSVEHSLYVSEGVRRQGIGRRLLDELVARALQGDYHAVIGAIDSTNVASVALHEKCGFALVGTLPQVGFKFGRWLDLCFYQRTLPVPLHPCDG